MDHLKKLLASIIDKWDELRLKRGDGGDDENPRRSTKDRRALDIFNIAKKDYQGAGNKAERDKVDAWIDQLEPDATFNLQAYIDCFLSENLIRKYIEDRGQVLPTSMLSQAADWQKREQTAKGLANISFKIRAKDGDLYYLDMDALAVTAEGSKQTNGNQSLWSDAIRYKPARNAVGHTGLLSSNAKVDLNLTHENIKGRLRTLLVKP
jgi:hypothetical protein